MKYILPILLVLTYTSANAQSTLPPYKRFPTVPPIQLMQLDNTLLTKDKLDRSKPTVIMFFSPDCDHCQHQMADIILRMKDLKGYQFVLATNQPEDQLRSFHKNYQLAKYANIRVGRDTKFLLPPFYQIANLPFLAFYNKKGNLVSAHNGNMTVDKMLVELKK